MAKATCIKCGGQSFECKEIRPEDSKYVLMSVQCTSCGGVIGVMDEINIGSMLEEIKTLVMAGIE